MFIKINLLGTKVSNEDEDEFDDPVLRKLMANKQDKTKVITCVLNIEKDNIMDIFPSYSGEETQLTVFDKNGDELTYTIVEKPEIVIEKFNKLFNLELIDFKNV